MATFEVPQETATDDSIRILKSRLARMMKWHTRTLAGLAVLLLLVSILSAIRDLREANAALMMLLAL